MKFSKKTSHIVWAVISIIGVISMLAFTLLPILRY